VKSNRNQKCKAVFAHRLNSRWPPYVLARVRDNFRDICGHSQLGPWRDKVWGQVYITWCVELPLHCNNVQRASRDVGFTATCTSASWLLVFLTACTIATGRLLNSISYVRDTTGSECTNYRSKQGRKSRRVGSILFNRLENGLTINLLEIWCLYNFC
jgi:hypothetical protein